MQGLSAFWLVLLGVVAGFFYAPLLVHWLSLFLSAIGKFPATTKREAVARRSMLGVSLAVIHPAPWLLLVGVPYAFVHFHDRPAWADWLWFIGSAIVTSVGLWTFALLMMHRNQRRAAKVNASGDEHVA
jgi:hypothetical protein